MFYFCADRFFLTLYYSLDATRQITREGFSVVCVRLRAFKEVSIVEIILYFLYIERGNAKNAHWVAIMPDGHKATHFLKKGVENYNYVSAEEALDDFEFSWPHDVPAKRLPMVVV